MRYLIVCLCLMFVGCNGCGTSTSTSIPTWNAQKRLTPTVTSLTFPNNTYVTCTVCGVPVYTQAAQEVAIRGSIWKNRLEYYCPDHRTKYNVKVHYPDGSKAYFRTQPDVRVQEDGTPWPTPTEVSQ